MLTEQKKDSVKTQNTQSTTNFSGCHKVKMENNSEKIPTKPEVDTHTHTQRNTELH